MWIKSRRGDKRLYQYRWCGADVSFFPLINSQRQHIHKLICNNNDTIISINHI
jgi:hypothetical protein